MKAKKEIVAMLLAGGQGNRLYVLTQTRAKPAVPFGGKYRIIDFTLSNCSNSGIDTVGVLTQYRPHELNAYIGNGQPWDLDRMYGGVTILPPYVSGKTGAWYRGTADAIFQNLDYIGQFDPEYVLVLSGDHVYKMDYARMLNFHKEKGADVTIAVLKVPMDEAPRFGILNTREDLSVYEFEEKPEKPKSDMASMGVYIFNYRKLKDYLHADRLDETSSNDFGKNVLPAMLNAGERVFAYPFQGYWKDVGTIGNLWEANMDLIYLSSELNLSDPLWRIYSRHEGETPHYVGEHGMIVNSLVAAEGFINGTLVDSVLFAGVEVNSGAELDHAVVMRNAKIGAGAKISHAIIADDAVIEPGAIVGEAPEECVKAGTPWDIAVVGQGATVRAGRRLNANEMVAPGTIF